MKIAIIGAGHIGSAIVTCLAQGHLYNEKDIIVSNPNIDKLERLQEHFPAIHITTDNQQSHIGSRSNRPRHQSLESR